MHVNPMKPRRERVSCTCVFFYDDGCAWHISIHIIVTLTLIFDRIELDVGRRTFAWDVDWVKCIENYKLRCFWSNPEKNDYISGHKRFSVFIVGQAVQRQFASIMTSILHTCRSCSEIFAKKYSNAQLSGCGIKIL